MTRITLRLSKEITAKIDQAVADRGFDNMSAFIRQAIEDELNYGGAGLSEVEARIAASHERLGREVRGVQTAQQAEYALLDSFVRLFLMCVPEPSDDMVNPIKARAAARYGNFIKNVARNMTGDSRRALGELLGYE